MPIQTGGFRLHQVADLRAAEAKAMWAALLVEQRGTLERLDNWAHWALDDGDVGRTGWRTKCGSAERDAVQDWKGFDDEPGVLIDELDALVVERTVCEMPILLAGAIRLYWIRYHWLGCPVAVARRVGEDAVGYVVRVREGVGLLDA